VAPSTELRKWFSHDPSKYEEFRHRYYKELDAHAEAWQPILAAARKGIATLLYSSHDAEHNNAVALKRYLDGKLGK
jgi:uncharacterized protein YeaO (DUF488 family)